MGTDMPNNMTAAEVLDREMLAVRAKLIEVAATLDRIDRADGDVAEDPRIEMIRKTFDILASGKEPDRAEQLQMVFSLPFQEDWRDDFDL